MTQDPRRMRFSRIETRAVLPDGRVITSWYSFPRGVGKDVYDAIDAALVRAYGNFRSRTEGTLEGASPGVVGCIGRAGSEI